MRTKWRSTTWKIPPSLWDDAIPPISLEHYKDQECEKGWTSIAGSEGRTVANYIGHSFWTHDGAPILMQSGNMSTCFTPPSYGYDYDFGSNVKLACWPAGIGEMEPEGNHVVRVTLELPLYCDPDQTIPFEDNPEQTILVQADVALCGDDAGEDRRSIREVADNQ